MSNRSKVLRTLLVLGIVACIAGAGVFSAFSSQTDNPGNIITAGTVKLEDNDGGSALYVIAGAKPGDTKTSCIKVSYVGSLASTVKLFTPHSAPIRRAKATSSPRQRTSASASASPARCAPGCERPPGRSASAPASASPQSASTASKAWSARRSDCAGTAGFVSKND